MAFTVCIEGVEVHCDTLDELDELIKRARTTATETPIHRAWPSSAREVREMLGVAKPLDAEWTWEKALDAIRGLIVERNVARERVNEVTTQRERCDRIIEDLTKKKIAEAGKLAEQLVYKAIVPAIDARHVAFHSGWKDMSQASKSELVTLMIEKIEELLK